VPVDAGRFALTLKSRREIEPQEPGGPRVVGILDDVVFAPLLSEEMADYRQSSGA
jgi:hypothetical protein